MFTDKELEDLKFFLVHSTEGWDKDGEAGPTMTSLLKKIDVQTGIPEAAEEGYGYSRGKFPQKAGA